MAKRRRRDSRWDLTGTILIIGVLIAARTKNLWYGIAFVLAFDLLPALIRRQIKARRSAASGIVDADHLEGIAFEHLLADRFRATGWKVATTPKYGDFGADLIIEKDGEKVVVQAKRHAGTVGIDAVQEVIGAVNYYQANRAMVITNSEFTPSAEQLAASSGVELWSRSTLEQFLIDTGKQVRREEKGSSTVCPRCGRALVKRKGKYGEFWGCSGYPSCTYTRALGDA